MYRDQIKTLIRGSFPLIHIVSREYDRIHDEIVSIIEELNREVDENKGWQVYSFSQVDGLIKLDNGQIAETVRCYEVEDALLYLTTSSRAVCIMRNMNLIWNDPFRKPKLLDILYKLYSNGIINSVSVINIGLDPIPSELLDYFTVVNFSLPDLHEIRDIISSFEQTYNIKVPEEAVSICKGMSRAEIENTLVISYLSTNKTKIALESLKEEKAKIVNKTGLLEWIQDLPSEKDIGGLDTLIEWFKRIGFVMNNLEKAREYGIPYPKGCLLCGLPGTGKTLTAKVIASIFKLPLFRLDIGRLLGSYVGETERNTREVFKLVEAMSPCIILIDEIEKALAGGNVSSHVGDSGVMARLIGSFLYETQERKSPAYYICTSNNVNALPPELIRKGRFDEVWYVSLPTPYERFQIWKVHLRKTGRDLKNFDYRALVQESEGYTGAEIEAIVIQTLYTTFYEGREPTTEDLISTMKTITPFSVIHRDYVEALETWAQRNNIRKANVSKQKNFVKTVDKKIRTL